VALVAVIFLLPWHGVAVLPCLRPVLGRHLGRWALLPPAASFLITLRFVTSTSYDQGLLSTLPWFPALGVNFSLWLDSLSVFFASGHGVLSGPVGAHMIAHAAYRTQVPLHDRTIIDEWKMIEAEVANPRRDD
jgi:NADH:ubiquinone oxidoreductase subunit 4 (subunit M)